MDETVTRTDWVRALARAIRLEGDPGAGEHEEPLAVHHHEHRLEPPQRAIRAPLLRQLDGGALELSPVLFELRLEAGEQRE